MKNFYIVTFILCASVALVAFAWLFVARHNWYISEGEFIVFNTSIITASLAIVGMWIWFPSRVLVGIIASAALVWPAACFAKFGLDSYYLGVSGIVVLLLIIVTHARLLL